MILSIDIGGTAVKIGLVNRQGEVLAQHEASVCFDNYQTPILHTVIKQAQAFGSRFESIEGIGVSAAGQIDAKSGIVIGTNGKIPNYEGAHIKREMEQAFQVPVSVLNDANAAVLGECFVGAAAGLTDVVMLTLGTGVGGGIVIGGHVYGGARGIAGEIGHFSLYQDGKVCACGKRGCFENYAATSALVRAACKVGNDSSLDGRLIFERAAQGDLQMKGLIAHWIDDIAAGITGLVHIFNPQMVLIGGGVSMQEKLFIAPLRERVSAGVMPRFAEGLGIARATLGNRAGLIGASKFWMETMEK